MFKWNLKARITNCILYKKIQDYWLYDAEPDLTEKMQIHFVRTKQRTRHNKLNIVVLVHIVLENVKTLLM